MAGGDEIRRIGNTLWDIGQYKTSVDGRPVYRLADVERCNGDIERVRRECPEYTLGGYIRKSND